MEREPFLIATSERGRIAVASDAIVQIVGSAAAESYAVAAPDDRQASARRGQRGCAAGAPGQRGQRREGWQLA